MKSTVALLLAVFAASLSIAGCAEIERGVRTLPQVAGGGQLDERTVVAGLREALRVGSGRAVDAVGRVDGFLGNALIRVALPPSYQEVAKGLRRVGLGSRVEELEVAMNRAAEQAAGEARAVLWEAVQGMSISEGFRILNGGETAATDYFRARTGETLRRRFTPIVQAKMREVGLYRLHKEMADTYLSLPFSRREHLVDLDRYVTDQALEGLFKTLAQEERRIRRDPAARSTQLLREVFGR